MATELLMPALSPTMEEGTLAKWLVKEGEFQLQRPQAAGASGVNPTCRALKIVSGRVGFSKSKAR